MSYKFTELRNIHKGEDIWILLAGSSMDYLDPSLFENKITIGQNQIYRHFPCNYVIMKDCNEKPRFPESLAELDKLNTPVLYSEYYKGHNKLGKNRVALENSFYFKHNPRREHLHIELENLLDGEIVVSRSTVTSAMHVAAYMGAKNIFLCGHDCGTIDGKKYFKDYMQNDWVSAANWNGIDTWLSKLENESKLIRDYLKEKYDCNIHSLNPFLNMNFESHTYKPL